MKKLTKTIAIIIGVLVGQNVQAQSLYYTGFDTDGEKANWTQFQKGKVQTAKWEVIGNGVSGPSKLSHSAPTGDADKDSLVNWYVSPKFDFSEGGVIDSLKFNYFCFMNTFFAEQVVQVYLLVGSKDPSLASSKTVLADFTSIYSGDNSLWKDTGKFVIPNTAGDCYIAFKFVAIDGWSSIAYDNIYITSNRATSITDVIGKNNTFLYPNPTSGLVKVVSHNQTLINSSLKVYNNLGILVWERSLLLNDLNIELPQGNYFYTISNNKIVTELQKLIIKE